MTLAALFIAQATGVHLSWEQQALLLGVAMLSSKGAAGVTGAGFITLAATLSVVPAVPVAGMALILGVDRFMSECRALTNFIGNAVAAIVVSRWEKGLDAEAFKTALNPKTLPSVNEPIPDPARP
jgi:aerobic C4-dicarboxylate transport protein